MVHLLFDWKKSFIYLINILKKMDLVVIDSEPIKFMTLFGNGKFTPLNTFFRFPHFPCLQTYP